MEWVTIQEASLRLNVPERTIRQSIRDGELRAERRQGPEREYWAVELPKDGWLDSDKRAYIQLAESLPRWWWPTAQKSGKVHYVENLGIEEVMPEFLCGLHSENIWPASDHSADDRCPRCVATAKEKGFAPN